MKYLQEEENEVTEQAATKSFEAANAQSRDIIRSLTSDIQKNLLDKIAVKFGASKKDFSFNKVVNTSRKSLVNEERHDLPANEFLHKFKSNKSKLLNDSLNSQEVSILSKTNIQTYSRQNQYSYQYLMSKKQGDNLLGRGNSSNRGSGSTDGMRNHGYNATSFKSQAQNCFPPNQYSMMKKKEIDHKLKMFELKSGDTNQKMFINKERSSRGNQQLNLNYPPNKNLFNYK